MNVVQQIRDYSKVQAIKANLKKRCPRDYLLFTLGINTGCRISDLLKLKVSDVKNTNGSIKSILEFKESKTKKNRRLFITKDAKEALQYYFNKTGVFGYDEYLFTSNKSNENRPLTGVRAWQMINGWAREVGITDKIGTHTLRKTAGYMMRTRGGIAIELISEVLGHSNVKVTNRYIGITDDELVKTLKNFSL